MQQIPPGQQLIGGRLLHQVLQEFEVRRHHPPVKQLRTALGQEVPQGTRAI